MDIVSSLLFVAEDSCSLDLSAIVWLASVSNDILGCLASFFFLVFCYCVWIDFVDLN